MCLLALFFRVVEDAPVVAGANREEFYHRGGEPPRILEGPRRAVAGVDPVSGGTWFGVNDHRVLVAVTNRRKMTPPAAPRSRGLLVRDLLDCASAAEATERATRELEKDRYEGCNIVCADADGATVVHGGDWLRVRPLPPGLHVLTNGDMNEGHDRRLALVAHLLGQEGYRYRAADDCLHVLRRVCARHEPGEPPVCLHGADRGTVSSSVVALRGSLADSAYWHAQGPPDRVPYADCSHLLRGMAPDHYPASE
jgi:uncharacterized protein with NRDE domain